MNAPRLPAILMTTLFAVSETGLAQEAGGWHCIALEIRDFRGDAAKDGFNHIIVELTNQSVSETLDGLEITIERGVFDGPIPLNDNRSKTKAPPGGAFTLHEPDFDHGGGQRSRRIRWSFEGFDPGERFRFDVDVDGSGSDDIADARRLLFNNGPTANAAIAARFSDGSVIEATLPDGAMTTSYTFVFPSDEDCIPSLHM